MTHSSPENAELLALHEWMREPDWAEDFSLEDITDWINRRPTHITARLLVPAQCPPAEDLAAFSRLVRGHLNPAGNKQLLRLATWLDGLAQAGPALTTSDVPAQSTPDRDQIALDAAHQIEALPTDLREAQKTARIQMIVLAALSSPPAKSTRPRAFLDWAVDMFGPVAKLRSERLLRFVEEAIELAHAEGMERTVFNKVADRVYSRPAGDTPKEIGQAQACLETFAENIGLSSDGEAQREWERVQGIPRDEWGRRHTAKQALGIALTLPNPPAQSTLPPPPLMGRAELIALLEDLASVNLPREACSRQARRMADDLIARGLAFTSPYQPAVATAVEDSRSAPAGYNKGSEREPRPFTSPKCGDGA